MNRLIKTIVGVALVAAGIFVFVRVPERGAAYALAFCVLGGFFVSQSLMVEALKAAGQWVAPFMPWRKQ